LIDKVVETDFGYHIIKVTEGPVRTKYRLGAIQKNIVPSNETREATFKRASIVATAGLKVEDLRETIKKDASLTLLTADQIDPNAENVNTLTNARELVRWANNAGVGEVRQEVFDLENQYVVAALIGKNESGDVKMEDYKEQSTFEVRKQKKAAQIIAKLSTGKGTLEDIAKSYGVQAQVNTANELSFGNPQLPGIGNDAIAVGRIFGMKPGQRSKPFAGDAGVLIAEVIKKTEAPKIADYTQFKTQLKQINANRIGYMVNEAVKEAAKIKDLRYKFF
jgi:peptidyl-prolyl cis-trans isomerase D